MLLSLGFLNCTSHRFKAFAQIIKLNSLHYFRNGKFKAQLPVDSKFLFYRGFRDLIIVFFANLVKKRVEIFGVGLFLVKAVKKP